MKLKIQNATLIKIGLTLAFIASAMSFVLWNLTRTSEASLNFTHHPSASFGIAAGQAARLNIVNTDPRERRIFVAQFLDEDGNVLRTARAVVEPKHSFGLLLPAREILGGEIRSQIRAVVWMQGSRSNLLPGSVEIYDETTGRTSFGLLLPANDFDPQPEPPAPQ